MTSPQKFSVQGSAPQPQGNVSCGGHAGVQSAPLGRVSVDREEQLKHQQRARQEHPHHHHHDEGSRRAQLQSQSPAATEETVVESSSSEPFPRARLDPLVGRGRVEVPDEEAEYLRRNVEHLRSQKHRLEDRVQSLEARVQGLEKTKNQYKMLYEQAQKEAKCRSGGEQELFCLHEQLQAVTYLKDNVCTQFPPRIATSLRPGEIATRSRRRIEARCLRHLHGQFGEHRLPSLQASCLMLILRPTAMHKKMPDLPVSCGPEDANLHALTT